MAQDRSRGRGRGRTRGGGHGTTGGRNRGGGFHHNASESVGESHNTAADGEMNAHIQECIRGPYRGGSAEDQSLPQFLKVAPNQDIRQYLQQQENLSAQADTEEWLQLPEIPGNEEVGLLPDEEVELLPNKVRGKWKSTKRYLKAHYELLREDAISPLRDAVDTVKNNPHTMDNQNLSVYEKVRLVGFTFSPWGIAARISFSTYRAQRRILWSGSKRLVSGGLVALSPAHDVFQKNCIIAVIAARPLSGVNSSPPEIDLFFPRPEDYELDPQKEFIMVEARNGYFEAYRHTLLALQKMSLENFPLAPHICSMSPDITPPTYLEDDPHMNLSPASLDRAAGSYGNFDVLNNWPSHERSDLDDTQWSALNQILTKRLAIIHGPPGTGKTFVSTVALEILHSHLKQDDPPIIIAAQTNHALDQLLNHVSRFEPNFIRLGGRSTNPEVKKRSLYEVRKQNRIDLVPGSFLRRANNVVKEQSKEMRELLEPLRNQVTPFDLSQFIKEGAISDLQGESLNKVAARWVSADGAEINPLEQWLGNSLSRFEVEYRAENFGFEEADLDEEFEQLKEQEAEDGVQDEEETDLLVGPWCAVFDPFTAGDASEGELGEARHLLSKTPDLWKIPHHMREPVYQVMKQRLKDNLLQKFREKARAYQQNMKQLKIGRWERDFCYLKQARIVGLTTTGLSKYRPLLSALHPKIVLIEEAAEVLEAPVSVACMDSVEHLILVGDHEQLQGHCSVRELENDPYYLNVSLFERLVRNRMPYSTLLKQRRMDPEFRALLGPIYPDLDDHPSVKNRGSIDWGMGNVKSFFFDHRWLESRDSQMSTLNEEEARFIAAFYRYLVLNGITASNVTILTFYNGQRKRLLKEIRAFPELKQMYNNVKTVDSYQGEENTIVLLSLARHNYDNKIGFLENRNRVCVALSRAKQGFYIFGSTEVLARDPMWMSVVRQMKSSGRLGSTLTLTCKKHGNRRHVSTPEELVKGLGGCLERCMELLSCSHVCQLRCHGFAHEAVQCANQCDKQLFCGHPCEARCLQECSCRCSVFEQSRPLPSTFSSSDVRAEDESSLEPRSLATSELEPYMDGMYISGKTDLPDESFIYLPHQASRNQQSSGTSRAAMNGETGVMNWMHGRSPGMDRRGMRPQNYSWGTSMFNGRAPGASSDPFSLHSDEEQFASRQQWTGFARGGVVEADRQLSSRREESSVALPQRARRQRESGGRPVLGEQAQQIRGGRTRYVQNYRPAGYDGDSRRPDGAGQGDQCGDVENAEKEEVELLIDL